LNISIWLANPISKIPYNLILTTKFNESLILITIISCDYLNLSLADEHVGDVTIPTQVIEYDQNILQAEQNCQNLLFHILPPPGKWRPVISCGSMWRFQYFQNSPVIHLEMDILKGKWCTAPSLVPTQLDNVEKSEEESDWGGYVISIGTGDWFKHHWGLAYPGSW
jgi:hypothetical protein